MTTQTLLTLFLASPGDVAAERDIVERIVDEYNDAVGAAHGVRVQVVRWEKDARPGWGKDGQAMINGLIEGRDHSLFVVLFWNRFGTPTPRAKSGTLEEFNLAVKARLGKKRPEIMVYFNTAPFSPTTERELEQKKEVLAFKATIKDGLYATYRGKTAFEKKFRLDYGKWLMEEIAALKKPLRTKKTEVEKVQPPPLKPTPKPRAPQETSFKPKGRPILLNGDLFYADTVTESGSTWKIVVRPQNAVEDRKLRSLGDQNQYHQQFSIVYDLQAGRAQAAKPSERLSDGKGVFWTLELRFVPVRGVSPVNFGSMNADEIAQKKAEWLLLAKKPIFSPPKNSWESTDTWAEQQIIGRGKEGEPILPTLWEQLKGDSAKFKVVARLQAVSRLLNEGVCEHIDLLDVGATRAGKVAVKFRGTRPSVLKREAQIVEVQGQCTLEQKS